MEKLLCYKQMPVWTKDTLPQMFQEKHNTKEGTWAKLTILKGELKWKPPEFGFSVFILNHQPILPATKRRSNWIGTRAVAGVELCPLWCYSLRTLMLSTLASSLCLTSLLPRLHFSLPFPLLPSLPPSLSFFSHILFIVIGRKAKFNKVHINLLYKVQHGD